MESIKRHSAAKTSDIAHEAKQVYAKYQSRFKKLEGRGLIECLTPEK